MLFIAGILAWLQPWQVEHSGSLAVRATAAIAVLPFDNLSDDPQQGYFADCGDTPRPLMPSGGAWPAIPTRSACTCGWPPPCLGQGDTEDAEWEADQVLILNPDFSVQRMKETFPFKDPREIEHFIAGLTKAGLVQSPNEESP